MIEGFPGAVIAIVAIILLLLLPNIKIDHLLPMLERGVMPVMMGSIQMVGLAVLPLAVLGMIYPVNVEDVKEAKKAIFKGFCMGATVLFTVILMNILVMGGKAIVNLRYPAFIFLFRSVSEQLQLIPLMVLVFFLDTGFMPVIMLVVALTRKWLGRGGG